MSHPFGQEYYTEKDLENVQEMKRAMEDEGFKDWLNCRTYAERLKLKEWYSMRGDKNLSWEEFLREHYESNG